MTEVRDATAEDIDFLMQKARAFNDKHFDIPLNEAGMRDYLLAMIQHENGVCLITDSGVIVGVLHTDPRWDWTVLVETGWFSEGRDGLRLLEEFEKRGRDAGVDEVRMTTLAVNSGVDRLLARKGYTPIETSHRLKL